ncbi:hypothetical protein M153_11700012089 [Pseudoloma neurophilia]|uniref:Uncharacterized protein n=1 Tax=Pseudoloma neurophilia TaxID=146866 RepID=A0A0R0M033_9MICR|nr:hypothetical protein M153_11700012089 [Pseudoloma neurophilia]
MSLRSQNTIPLHNIDVIISDLMNITKDSSLFSILSNCVQYSINVRVNQKKNLHKFLRTIFNAQPDEIAKEFFICYRNSTVNLLKTHDAIISEEIDPKRFIHCFFTFESYPQPGQDYIELINKLRIIKHFSPHLIPKIQRYMRIALTNGTLPVFFSCISKPRYKKYKFVGINGQQVPEISHQLISDNQFEKEVFSLSYASKHSICWPEEDAHRLHAGFIFHKRKLNNVESKEKKRKKTLTMCLIVGKIRDGAFMQQQTTKLLAIKYDHLQRKVKKFLENMAIMIHWVTYHILDLIIKNMQSI